MKRFTLRRAAAVCAMAMLPLAAQAQVAQPDQPAQSDQAQPGQALQGQTQPRQVLTPPATPQTPGSVQTPGAAQLPSSTPGQEIQPGYEARRVDPSATAGQAQQGLQGFFVQKMMHANKAEIELSQLAQQKSQNAEVKAFAQQMIQDHQQLNQKLQGLASGTSTRTTGTAQAGQSQSRPGQSQTSQSQTSSSVSVSATSGQGELQQLGQIMQQAGDTHLQMVKQMLQQYQGQDFDMGYLGQQIAAHTHMVAHLQAIQKGNVGTPEFQQLVSQAEQSSTEHLDRAKQIAKQLEDKEGGVSQQGSRSGTTGRATTDRTQPGQGTTPQRNRPRSSDN